MKIVGDLTKAKVLELADEITIFSKYLGISESIICDCIETGKLINSPLRDDDNDASAGFKYSNKGKLRLRDFNGYFWGDCFDLVALYIHRNVNNKHDFMYILQDIYNTVTARHNENVRVNMDNRAKLNNIIRTKRVIEIEAREWNIHDRYYWNDMFYKVKDTFGFLNSEYVYPVQHYWSDRDSQPNPKYYYKADDPCYAYFLGYDENNIANYRLYFPFRKKPYSKFITNNSSYQGLLTLPDTMDALLIIKSRKDSMSAKTFLAHTPYVIGTIAPPSENHKVSEEEFNWLASKVTGRFKDTGKVAILSMYDFDYTGLNGSGHLKRAFGVPRFMFTNGKYHTDNIGNKDFSATIPMYGKIPFFKQIDNFITKLNIV